MTETSASPAETNIALRMCLPARQGGYGIVRPAMNKAIKLPLAVRKMAGAREYRPDFYWKQFKLCLEYQSDEWHLKKESSYADARRANNLQFLGLTVVTAWRPDIADINEFENLMRRLLRHMGKRAHRVTPAFIRAQRKLVHQLHETEQLLK